MKSKLYLSLIPLVTLFMFSGCDKSNTTSFKDGSGDNSRVVTVELGDVYDATVTDASGNSAKQITGTNKYEFNTDIVFPVKAIGGWVDVNNDGEKDLSDILLTSPLYSYSNNITPITTYLADSNPLQRAENIQNTISMLKTVSDIELTEEQLLSLPSEVSAETIFLSNVIFENMAKGYKDNENNYIFSTQNIINDYIELNDTFKSVVNADLDALMIATESHVISNIKDYVTHLTEADLVVDINKIYSVDDLNIDSNQMIIIYNNYPKSYWNTLNDSYIENGGYEGVSVYEVDSLTTCNDYPNSGMCQSVNTGYYNNENDVTNFVVIANNSNFDNVIDNEDVVVVTKKPEFKLIGDLDITKLAGKTFYEIELDGISSSYQEIKMPTILSDMPITNFTENNEDKTFTIIDGQWVEDNDEDIFDYIENSLDITSTDIYYSYREADDSLVMDVDVHIVILEEHEDYYLVGFETVISRDDSEYSYLYSDELKWYFDKTEEILNPENIVTEIETNNTSTWN